MMIDLMGTAIQSQVPPHRVEKTSEPGEPRSVEGSEEARQSLLDLAHGKVPRLPKVVEWKKEHFSGEARYDAKGHLLERSHGEVQSSCDPMPIDITV
ncbi:MAG: hypothetical protein AB1512_00115 [Thermodesulfobacteriota bacterium]